MKKLVSKNNLIFLCLVLLVISMVCIFNYTNARYVGEVTYDDNVLAQPILTLSNNNQEYTIINMIPGDEKTYEFSVSNVDESKTNEIFMKYTLKASATSDIPLKLSLYDVTGEESEITLTNGVSGKINLKEVQNDGDKITRNYKLKVKWDSTDNSYQYANKEISVKVELNAQQESSN